MRRVLHGAAATFAAGSALGEVVRAGDLIGLVGELGAGKTLFVQGLAAGLGVPPEVRVTSPTFTLLNEYRGGREVLHHADLYRLSSERDLEEVGLLDVLGRGVVAVEWSDRFALLPADHLTIRLEQVSDDDRMLEASSGGSRSSALLAAWQAS